jgi:hypothetical protein
MTKLRWALITAAVILADLVINTFILMITYPIWRELRYQRYPTDYWLHVYCSAGALGTIVVSLTSVVSLAIMRRGSRIGIALVQVAISFIALSALAIIADFSEPSPADTWPQIMQQIAAKFFAELQSIKFTVLTASSMAIVSGVFVFLVLSRSQLTER